MLVSEIFLWLVAPEVSELTSSSRKSRVRVRFVRFRSAWNYFFSVS